MGATESCARNFAKSGSVVLHDSEASMANKEDIQPFWMPIFWFLLPLIVAIFIGFYVAIGLFVFWFLKKIANIKTSLLLFIPILVPIYSYLLNVENSDFTKLNKKVDDEIMRFSKIYSIDGRENLSKTGSNFKKSYILDDLKICSLLFDSIIIVFLSNFAGVICEDRALDQSKLYNLF